MFGARLVRISYLIMFSLTFSVWAQSDVEARVKALRLSGMITGGVMPTDDPIFEQMVTKIQEGKDEDAAQLAARSRYFASYLARRLALQMQTPALDAEASKDNDATAFLIAHFAGAGNGAVKPSISSIWSENATYQVRVMRNGSVAQVRVKDLTPAERRNVNWSTDLVRVEGQLVTLATVNSANQSVSFTANQTLPLKHVGGYTTLGNAGDEGSFAQYGALNGTNLRYIEGLWMIATGLTLNDVSSTDASYAVTPRFIPQDDKNFESGQGQMACFACHGGGFASLNHGYSALADTFNFDPELVLAQNRGLIFYPTTTTRHRKSLGSDEKKREDALVCDLNKTPKPECAPSSIGIEPNQGWNVGDTWARTGVLDRMGWDRSAPTMGQGLNELGSAIGKSRIVYERMTKRVMNEICPLGTFRKSDLDQIVSAVNPFIAPVGSNVGTDDIRDIVAKVATHPSCQ